MKRLVIGVICLGTLALGVWPVFRVDPGPAVDGPSFVVPPAATIAAPLVDMSSKAQARASDACQKDVAGGKLLDHRRGKTGLSEDKALLYAWGEPVVRVHTRHGYEVRSSVDTLTGYSGNVVRTPFVCHVSEDFMVVSVNFERIQFPNRSEGLGDE